MNILVIGSGGREHAITWKLKQSPRVKEIYCAPGNGGIAQMAQCIDIDAADMAGLLDFALQKKIDLTVVGPEAALAKGIVDQFSQNGLKVFGPTQAAAQLEASKAFAKEFMQRHHIPMAHYEIFDSIKRAFEHIDTMRESTFPVVIKADGLAAGKGVIICSSPLEAKTAVQDMMERKVFKEAGNKVVIEEYLQGEEVSILAVSDGEDFVLFESSQDHKRIFDNDQGPNTGGMGAYSPVPMVSQKLAEEIKKKIIAPVIHGMKEEKMPFKGILYAGLMITSQGPYVLEFNVRFGDPEAQAVIPRLRSDLLEVILAVCEGGVNRIRLDWDRRSCVCVVVSSGGYPGVYETGKEIFGLGKDSANDGTIVFHAGTQQKNGRFFTSGGRVLGVTALGNDLEEAIKKAYTRLAQIHFGEAFFRKDIGAKALRQEHKKTRPQEHKKRH